MYKLLFLIILFYENNLKEKIRGEEVFDPGRENGLATYDTGNSIDLMCTDKYFSVDVTLTKKFQGVIYMRGTYHDRRLPCFKRHNQYSVQEDDKILFSLKIPFNKCQTEMDLVESYYVNTLVIQHDPELIKPGDSAYSLYCAFQPEFSNSTSDATETLFLSKIIVVSADPTKANSTNGNLVVLSETERVSFVSTGKKFKAKEEL